MSTSNTWAVRMPSCLSMTMLLTQISIAFSSAANTAFSAILLYPPSASFELQYTSRQPALSWTAE
jgi:hypothetical protein